MTSVTRGVLPRLETTKIVVVFGRGSAPDPAEGAYNAIIDPLVRLGGDSIRLLNRRFWRLSLGASVRTKSS